VAEAILGAIVSGDEEVMLTQDWGGAASDRRDAGQA
jgi:hypothetical protein